MKPTDAPPHPSDWTTSTVGQAVTIQRGVSWAKDQEHDAPREGAWPILRIGNVQEHLLLDDLLYVSGVTDKAAARRRVSASWTLMVGSNGNRDRVGNAVLIRDDTDFLFASFLIGVRPKDGSGLSPGYFHRWLTSAQVQSYLSASSEGTTGLNNLSHSFFRAMTIPFPESMEEQAAIVAVLDAVDHASDRVAAELQCAREAKLAIAQTLFRSGTRNESPKKAMVGLVPESRFVMRSRRR